MKTLFADCLKFQIFLAFLILLDGCAIPFSTGNTDSAPPPPIVKTFNANTVSFQDFQEGGVALGGVVIRQGVAVYRYPDLPTPGKKFDHYDQTEFWSSNCEREFAENVSNLSLTPFFRFNDFIEDDLLASVWAKYAQGGFLQPEILNSVHSAGSEIRFMILFRVEHDDIFHEINTAWSMFQNSQGDLGKVSGGGHDPDQVNKSNHPTIKRVVGVTMSVYDLETALCVWEAGVVDDVTESIDPENLNDFVGYQAKQIETGQVVVVEEEEFPEAPAFNRVMDKCLDTLYTDLKREVDPSFRRR